MARTCVSCGTTESKHWRGIRLGLPKCWNCYNRDYQRKKALENPGWQAEYKRLLRTKCPGRFTHSQRRKQRFRDSPVNDFTPTQWREIINAQSGLCYYCNESSKLVKEHKTPLSRGGSNTKTNIVGACVPCNTRKSTMTEEEYWLSLQTRKVGENVG